MRRLLALLALSACALSPAIARAQSIAAGAPPSARVEGAGIALGDSLVLHLGIGAEVRYDSNFFYETNNTTQGLSLHLTPGFLISTVNSQRSTGPDGQVAPHKIEFRLGAGLDYVEWLAHTGDVKPDRQFNVLANGDLIIAPTGPFTAEIFDNFIRSSQAPYQKVTFNLDRDINEVGLRFRIKPGGGRLELQISSLFGVDFWENSASQGGLNAYDNYYVHSTIRLLWKFLPKTAVYVEGDNYDYFYTSSDAAHPNGYPLRVKAGLNGLLTAKLSFDIYGGYGNGFYDFGPSPNTGIAGVSLTWKPYALASGTIAYRHDFENALFGVYADYDNVSISWLQQIWRFSGFLRLAYQNTRYQGVPTMMGTIMDGMTTHETNNGFTLNARVDYFAYRNWVAISLGYDFNLIRVDGNPTGVVPNPNLVGTFPVSFNKSEVYLGLKLFY